MADTPVYILTSASTFSAAEEFAYNLKHMERATIVGETTGGGAHPVDFFTVDLSGGQYASVSMPYGRAINPITGTFGPRRIFLENERLFYQRGEGGPHELRPLPTADRFHVGDLDFFRIQFLRDASGSVVKLVGQYNDGREDQNLRSD